MAALKPFKVIDKAQRVNLSLKESTRVQVEKFRLYYKSAHGVDVERSELVEALLVGWFDQDTDFLKFSKGLTPAQLESISRAAGAESDVAA